MNKEELQRAIVAYHTKKSRCNNNFIFKNTDRIRHAAGEWRHAVNELRGLDRLRTIDEIYRLLSNLAKDFRGIGRETVLLEACNIAERNGIPYEEVKEYLICNRKYARHTCSFMQNNMNNPLTGWELIDFLVSMQYQLKKLLRA